MVVAKYSNCSCHPTEPPPISDHPKPTSASYLEQAEPTAIIARVDVNLLLGVLNAVVCRTGDKEFSRDNIVSFNKNIDCSPVKASTPTATKEDLERVERAPPTSSATLHLHCSPPTLTEMENEDNNEKSVFKDTSTSRTTDQEIDRMTEEFCLMRLQTPSIRTRATSTSNDLTVPLDTSMLLELNNSDEEILYPEVFESEEEQAQRTILFYALQHILCIPFMQYSNTSPTHAPTGGMPCRGRRLYVIWREIDESNCRSLADRPAPNDPLGPYQMRKTLTALPGHQRYYNYPNGIEGISNISRSQLIPEWRAWAGHLGPAAYFRVKYGSLSYRPKRKKQHRYIPRMLRPYRPSPKTSNKNGFKLDFLMSFSPMDGPIRPSTCRPAFCPFYFSNDLFNSDGQFLCDDDEMSNDEEMEVFYWDTQQMYEAMSSLLSAPIAPPRGQPFDMFPVPTPYVELTQADYPYVGPFFNVSRIQLFLTVLYRCLALAICPVGSVPMDDALGIMLRRGIQYYTGNPDDDDDDGYVRRLLHDHDLD